MKSPTDFFAQNSLQFGRRAKRGEPKPLANSLLVPGARLELAQSNGLRALKARVSAIPPPRLVQLFELARTYFTSNF